MAFPFVIDPKNRLVRVDLNGTVRGDEISRTIHAIYQDARWQNGFDVVWDGTNALELLLEQGDLPHFVQLQREYGYAGRDLMLMARPLDITMARAYATIMKVKKAPREVYVVTSENELSSILSSASGTTR